MDDDAMKAVGEMIKKMMMDGREASEKHIEELMKKGQDETKTLMTLMEARLTGGIVFVIHLQGRAATRSSSPTSSFAVASPVGPESLP